MSEKKRVSGPSIVTKDAGTARTRRVLIPGTTTGVDTRETVKGLPLGKTRAYFRTEEFVRVIRQQGYYIGWRKAMVCPCLTAASDQPDPNCAFCDGSGWYHFDGLPIRGVMSRFGREQKMYEKFGSWVEGTGNLTVEAEYRVSYFDMIEMLDSIMLHSEVIKKDNRRAQRQNLPANKDVARYRIDRVVSALLIEGGQIVSLENDYHYKIDANGWIEWLDAASDIAAGTQISLLYEHHPVYLVMSHQNAFRDVATKRKSPVEQVASLPVQALIKLDFLANVSTSLPSLLARIATRDAEGC